MRKVALSVVLILILPLQAAVGAAQKEAAARSTVTLSFNGTEYLHRWSQNGQHEFTPPGQEDLAKWTDMLTINFYPQVTDGESLAQVANQVLGNYKAQNGVVLRTSSVPRTTERPAEHLIAVVFGRPTFLEAAHTRLKLVSGNGVSIVYSHRIYGRAAGPAMSAWLKENGASIESALMAWEVPSSLSSLQKSAMPKRR